MKLQVHDTYEKDKEITTNFKPVNGEDVINKSYLDEKLGKTDGQLSYIERDYIEFKLQYNKQPVEDVLIQRAVKTTIQVLYGRIVFDNFQNVDDVLKDFLFTTSRPKVEEVNDDIQ